MNKTLLLITLFLAFITGKAPPRAGYLSRFYRNQNRPEKGPVEIPES